MPSYRTHNSFNLLFLLPLSLVGMYYLLNPTLYQVGIFSLIFCYATLFMSPDMDTANKIRWFSLRGIFSIPFKTYAVFFRHRGISHSILFGSLTRILWLFLFVAAAFYLFGKMTVSKEHFVSLYRMHKIELLYGLSAIFLADTGHIFLDKIKKKS